MKKIIAAMIVLLLTFSTLNAFAYNGKNVNIDIVRDTKISDILYALAYEANMSIIINAKLDSMVKGSIHGSNLMDTLDSLALANNFNYEIVNGTIIVTPADGFTEVKSFSLRYANLDDAKRQLSLFIDEKKLQIDHEKSAINVDGTRQQLRKAAALLLEIDKPVRQVLLQVRLVEMSASDSLSLGLKYYMPAIEYDSHATIDLSEIKWGVISDATAALGKGKVLTSPYLVTPNGREASVKMLDSVPVFNVQVATDGSKTTEVSYKDVGVTFIATPRINIEADGTERVTMKVHPVVSTIPRYMVSKDGLIQAPVISSREAETVAQVRSGETIVIGGLLKNSDIDSMSKIPGLGDLPLLGELFKYRSTSKENVDVCVMVTPYILDNNGKIPAAVKSEVPVEKQPPAAAMNHPVSATLRERIDKIFAEEN